MLRVLAVLTFLWTATMNPCPSPAFDLGILIDGSSSFGNGEYILTKSFLVSLVQNLDVSTTKTHVGIGYYSNAPHLHAKLNDDRLYDPIKLMLSILSLPYPGAESRTNLALKMANDELFSVAKGDRPKVPNVLIVITHGLPRPRDGVYKEALKQLKARGTHVIAVGIGKDANADDLLEIALGKKEHVFHADTIEQLIPGKLSAMIKIFC